MRLPRINAEVVFVGVLLLALIYAVFFWHIKESDAFSGGVVIVPESPYQQCVDTCLAYNGYTSDVYNFCQYQCASTPTIVIGGVWIGGRWWPHGHYEPRHHEPRHDEPRHDHDHHGRR